MLIHCDPKRAQRESCTELPLTEVCFHHFLFVLNEKRTNHSLFVVMFNLNMEKSSQFPAERLKGGLAARLPKTGCKTGSWTHFFW